MKEHGKRGMQFHPDAKETHEQRQVALEDFERGLVTLCNKLGNLGLNPSNVAEMLLESAAIVGTQGFARLDKAIAPIRTPEVPALNPKYAVMGGDAYRTARIFARVSREVGEVAMRSGGLGAIFDELSRKFGPPAGAIEGTKEDVEKKLRDMGPGVIAVNALTGEVLGAANAGHDCGDADCPIHGKEGVLKREAEARFGPDVSNAIVVSAGTPEAARLLESFGLSPKPTDPKDIN